MKSKSKQQTTQQSNNTYGYMTPPTTQQQTAYDNHIQQAYDTPNPSINYQFANARQANRDSYDNPFGANISPEVQQAALLASEQGLNQAQGQALREDSYQRKQMKTGALATSAGMAAPQLVQTGGSQSGTMVGSQTQPIGPALIGATGALGSAAIT